MRAQKYLQRRERGLHLLQRRHLPEIQTDGLGRVPRRALRAGDQVVGQITSAVYSPRLEQNIALAMVADDYSVLGTQLEADLSSEVREVTVVEKPFFDPKKAIAASTHSA